jgi:hypothetical protein
MNVTTLSRQRLEIPKTTNSKRAASWFREHRRSLLLLALLLLAVGIAQYVNYDGYPGRGNDDEGTYADEAWAVMAHGALSHYTYWYDHPPLGWIGITLYAWFTHGFHTAPTLVTVARQFMLLASLASSAFMYGLGRRLKFSRAAAGAAVILFGFSPLAMYYHRLAFLDNIEVAWLLAALYLAASPRRNVSATLGSAACFAASVLSKETAAIMFPAAVWLLLQHRSRQDRWLNLMLFTGMFAGICGLYPLYALVKNELFAGTGHVSLLWALKWQLFSRPSTGGIFSPYSASHDQLVSWIEKDPWLLVGGLALVPAGLITHRLRPIALGLGVQVAIMSRPKGYLPEMYVIAMLPFAALLIAGVGDSIWKFHLLPMADNRWAKALRAAYTTISRGGVAVVSAAVVYAGIFVAPAWANTLHTYWTQDPSAYSLQATTWILHNVPHNATIVVDDDLWGNLIKAGYPNNIWLWKVDLDSAVDSKYLKHGWRSIQYVVLLNYPASMLEQTPTLIQAIDHSHIVATFGTGDLEMTARVVDVKAP